MDFFDRNGTLLFVSPLDDGLRREFVPLKEIPDSLRDAFVSAEDKKFYRHAGIDFLSVARAFSQNASENRTVSGASTITMQLARIISPSTERNFPAKIKDSFNALRLEARFSKRKILEMYLNNLPFGNNVEGVRSAARFYFGKDVNNLSIEETLLLSVVPRRPSKYNPVANPDICAKAAREHYNGDPAALFSAAREARRHEWPFFMPHYIRFVSRHVPPHRTSIVLSADMNVQRFVEGRIGELLKRNMNARIENAAAVVIENKTGNIIAWVGSQGFSDRNGGGQIDGVLVQNQAGSSMKPFLYALALERGFCANSVLPDIPTEFLVETEGNDFDSYRPENFNNRFNGPVLFRTALASSLNIPAVYLVSKIGVEQYLSVLLQLGFDSLRGTGRKADVGLALGVGEVSLLELTHAFTVFANDGILVPLERGEGKARRVFSAETARLICDILSDKKARVTGFGYSQTYETDYPSIFKTGTANQYQDIVALGSTADFTVGVWMGNFSGNTVVGKTGSSFPALIAKETLDLLTGKKSAPFAVPSLKKAKICALSGMACGADCPSFLSEYVDKSFVERKEVCSWHKRAADGSLVTEFPAVYQEWLSRDFYGSSINYKSSGLKIVNPKDNTVFYRASLNSSFQKIPVEVIGGKADMDELTVFYDSKKFRISRPFSFTIPVEVGSHVLRVVFGGESDEVAFTVE
ncbi:MAG: transglycosylase domain-containing protein [Treponema sp.]|nr:transglycosylase domain-containing protein [Treponema sp.]